MRSYPFLSVMCVLYKIFFDRLRKYDADLRSSDARLLNFFDLWVWHSPFGGNLIDIWLASWTHLAVISVN